MAARWRDHWRRDKGRQRCPYPRVRGPAREKMKGGGDLRERMAREAQIQQSTRVCDATTSPETTHQGSTISQRQFCRRFPRRCAIVASKICTRRMICYGRMTALFHIATPTPSPLTSICGESCVGQGRTARVVVAWKRTKCGVIRREGSTIKADPAGSEPPLRRAPSVI